ncbi:NAD(P)/FAD-dependent oxidoreductase [Spirosoma soli]|uniref:NAD(P)/FAD-dependent oxidoreductase n=1 Tax=Spirosoma soli TaxID=1770529 RepID=A0ABW5MBX0_9BACT
MPSSLIIGAGMAGLTAARELTHYGWDVTVVDKGRGVGGRMATRRLENARADHGAQYFLAHTTPFQQFVEQFVQKGIVTEWDLKQVNLPSATSPYYMGREGMSTIAKELAKDLTVRTNEKAVHLEKEATGWGIETEAGTVYRADAVIITIPAPQALTLLDQSGIVLVPEDRSALAAIKYEPCLTVLVALKQASRIPAPGGVRFEKGDVAWIADNQQKGISPKQPSVTIQASSAFSQTHLDGDLDSVGQTLIAQLQEYFSIDSVESYQVHRWRYSFASERFPSAFLKAQTSFPLLFGGDGFGQGNLAKARAGVEDAFTSGLKMAQTLMEL